MRSESILVLVILLAGLAGDVCAGTYSGGTGEPNDPYRIATANDLNDIGNHIEDFNKCFVMVNDINLADYTGTQFNIIGSSSDPFAGVFDGNGHTILNFTYSAPNADYVALFKYVESEGDVKNVNIVRVNVSGRSWVAGLVGWNDGRVSNCHAAGSVRGDFDVGGLVGYNSGTISNCHAAGQVSAVYAGGGLVGENSYGLISDCYATGTVTGTDDYVGGLVGYNCDGTVSNCYATGTVTGTDDYVGGLVGESYPDGTISNCYATGNVTGTDDWVGGLVGGSGSRVSKCYATGTVNGDWGVGGLVGCNYGAVADCYATGTVTGNSRFFGGLVGYNYKRAVSKCYAAGSVTGGNDAGGLVGYDVSGAYASCLWDSDVSPDVNGIGNTSDPNVVGKSTLEMQKQTTFTDAGWDFVEVWNIGEKQTYPFLRVYPAGDLNHDGIVNFVDVAIMADDWLEGGGS